MARRPDPSSFSDTTKVKTTSLHLVLTADLSSSTLTGHVDIAFERVNPSCQTLVLDAKALNISRIVGKESGKQLEYSLTETTPDFGSALSIELEPDSNAVTIFYSTPPDASGVQVLSPEQTFGDYPYLFTQCQAIHARSIVPCQDTPGVKAPYTAEITVAKPLTAVMSAVSVRTEESATTSTYFFEQKTPIPSYLIALVVGDIVYRDISPRVRVWSERANIDACFYEFGTTEEILQAAESIAGPYVWGRYDLVVLPPSFPYGGMENPCLTFVTPTLLAGDRSLVNVVAHEIAHSWTGNLVTNANWEHFWLNEGFTVFLERKILGKLGGDQGQLIRNEAAIGGLTSLRYAIEVFGADNPLTMLDVDLTGVDPDDAFSSVPYEKGFTLLWYLETLVGGPAKFDPFLHAYIQKHAYQSIKSDVFVEYFKSSFPGVEVEWEKWLKTPGMPLVIPEYDPTRQQQAIDTAAAWSENKMESIDKLTAKQVRSALELLLENENLTLTVAENLDAAYKFRESKNSEIIFGWCRIGIKVRMESVVDTALQFITTQGRMKFVRPLYRDLLQWDEQQKRAIDTFHANSKFYHNICRTMVEKDIQAAISKA